MKFSNQSRKTLVWIIAAWIMALFAGLCAHAQGQDQTDKPFTHQRQFASPDEAIKALITAAKTDNRDAMHEIFGPDVHRLMTGDSVQDKENFESFAREVEESCKPQNETPKKIVLDIGKEGWPFPIPLVKSGDKWFFDTEAGKEEIVNRHIGRDELNAIGVCRDYVAAQRKYFSTDRDGSGVKKYAQRFKSTEGKKDGLYWPVTGNEEASPFAPLVAEAHAEGYTGTNSAGPHPFHGYYFRILARQGSAAPGGKMNYIADGGMTRGFALVAYPEKWGKSGIMTFIVNQDGKVYQRNLGHGTVVTATAMGAYNPDGKWTLVEDEGILEK
jgi:Protein of unknown function (DUF2950)